jgi:hypothetical protein
MDYRGTDQVFVLSVDGNEVFASTSSYDVSMKRDEIREGWKCDEMAAQAEYDSIVQSQGGCNG